VSNEKVCGYFKGIIEVENSREKQGYKKYKEDLIKNLIQMINIVAK